LNPRSALWKEAFSEFLSRIREEDGNVSLRFTQIVFDEDQRPSGIFSKLTYTIVQERLLISVSALTIFSVGAFLLSSPCGISWGRAGLGVVSVLSTGLATGAGFGGLFYCGLEFSSLLTAIPFLALGTDFFFFFFFFF
jgi:hypothetical protein